MSEENKQPLEQEEVVETPEAQVEQESAQDEEKAEKKAKKKKEKGITFTREQVEQMAAAFELVDFGDWAGIIRSVVYEGLYAVGGAVLNGTFHKRPTREERNLIRKAGP